MDGRHEAARDQAQEDTGRDVVLADTVAKLAVLVEHFPEAERDGLRQKAISTGSFRDAIRVCSYLKDDVGCRRRERLLFR